MKLIPNWWDILKRAWSVRLLAVAALLSGFEVLLPIVRDYIWPIPSGWFAVSSFTCTVGAVFARIAAQNNITKGSDHGNTPG